MVVCQRDQPGTLVQTPYGSPLHAKLPLIPSVDSPDIDDEDLVFLAASNADARAVDIALMAMNDPGATADVDRLRSLVEHRTRLQNKERQLEREKFDLRQRWQSVTGRISTARIPTRLHPYLQGTALIPNPRNQAQRAASAGVPIADVMNDVVPMPPSWLEQPRLHDEEGTTAVAEWLRFTQLQHSSSNSPFPS